MLNNRFQNIIESRISANGNDTAKGCQDFAETFIQELNVGDANSKKINPRRVSLKSLAEALISFQYDKPFSWDASPDRIREALNSTHFPWITGELIHNMLVEGYQIWKMAVEPLVEEFDSTAAQYEYFAGIRAGKMPTKVHQGEPYQERSFDEKECRCELAKFGEIVNMTRELILADQTNEVMAFAKNNGEKLGKILHRMVIQTITDTARTDLGESTSTALYYAGSAQTVYSDDHSAIDGQTNDNSSTGVINATGAEAAYTLMAGMKDEAGDEILVDPSVVLTAPSVFPTAWKFFSTPLPYEPGSSNLTPSFWKDGGGGKIMPIQSPYITSPYWYLGNPKRQTRLYWGWRMETSSQGGASDAAFDRDVIARFKSSMKFGVALSDYRYMIYSTGA